MFVRMQCQHAAILRLRATSTRRWSCHCCIRSVSVSSSGCSVQKSREETAAHARQQRRYLLCCTWFTSQPRAMVCSGPPPVTLRSFHSTSPPPASSSLFHDHDNNYEAPSIALTKRLTERLHSLPIGSMTQHDWDNAYPSFLWWTQQRTPVSTKTAWQLLDRLVEEERASREATPTRLETFWLNRIVEASRTVLDSKKKNLVVGPMEWLDRIESSYGPYLLPNHATYGMIMDSLTRWRSCGDDEQQQQSTAEFVESLLDKMYAMSEQNPNVMPDVSTYNAVLHAWANSGLDDAPRRATQILTRMTDNNVRPDVKTFSNLIAVHASSRSDPSAAQHAESILRNLLQQQQQEKKQQLVTTVIYNGVITAWNRSRQPDSALHAERLLHEMIGLYEGDNNDAVKPDALSFGVVIKKLLYDQHVDRADAALRTMTEMYRAGGDLQLKPNRQLFDFVMDKWSIIDHPAAGERAESLLRIMNELYLEGNRDLKPRVRNFMPVTAAWTKRRHHDAAQRAQDVLEWMLKFDNNNNNGNNNNNNNNKMLPNVIMCTSIVNAWAKNRSRSAPENAEAMLRRMDGWYRAGNVSVKPNAVTYHSVMKAWAKSRHAEAPQRTEAILRLMQQTFQAGDLDVRPDRFSYNLLLNAWANSDDPSAPNRAEYILRYMDDAYRGGDDGMKPDKIAFTTVMKTWANSEMDGAAERAESLLRSMDEMYQSTGDPDLKPNAVVYSTVISAWVKSNAPDAAERAASLLDEIHELRVAGYSDMKPKKYVYYNVLELLAKSLDVDAGKRAERILLRMQELSDAGETNVDPMTKHFNLVLRAWSHCGHELAAPRAESILKLMQDLNDDGGGGNNANVRVNALSFNFCIKAWAKSGDIFAGKRAEQHLRKMQALYAAGDEGCMPNEFTYGDLAMAWSLSGHADADQKAKEYAEMSKRMAVSKR